MSAKEKMIEMVLEHETVKRYRKIEHLINENKTLKHMMSQAKQIQKQMVNAEKIGKKQAYDQFKNDYTHLIEALETFPLMSEYLELQEELNEMLQTVLEIIENGINKDLSASND